MCFLPSQILHLLHSNLPLSGARQVQFEMPVGQEARISNEHIQTSAEFRSLSRIYDAGNEILKLLYNVHSSKEDMSSRAYSSVRLSNPTSYYIIVSLWLTGPIRFAFMHIYLFLLGAGIALSV